MNNEQIFIRGREIAQKSYVDAAINAIPKADQDVYVLIPSNPDELTFFRPNTGVSNRLYHNVGTDHSDLRDQLKTILQKAYDKGVDDYSIVLHIDSNDIVFGPNAMLSKKPTSLILASNFIQQYGNDFKNTWLRKIKITITLTWDEDVLNIVGSDLSANDSRLLTGDNETAYTPTLDYHPSTKKYVDDSITTALGTIVSFTLTPVTELPTENISTSTIYLLSTETTETDNIYEEYVYVNSQWELIGTTKVDLSNYYTKDEIDALFEEKLGDIDTLLTDIVDSTLDAEGKEY